MIMRSRGLHRLTFATVAATLACVALAPVAAQADDNAVPSYEVKFDLTTTALDSSRAPLSAVKSAFGIGGSAEQRSYEYFDTDGQALDGAGWDVRLRHKDGEDFEETYKFRIPVSNGDVDAALDQANDDGFDSGDTNYDAEVDWGYSKQTLSFSNEKSHSGDDYPGTSMPSASTGRGWLVNEIPGKLDDWGSNGWGTDTLSVSRAHGPVTSKVWDGSWQGTDASIEVLPVIGASGSGTEYVTELSFKTDDENAAADVRADAIALADSNGWLYHGDILKTQLVLDRY